ncbi:MAG: DUF4845 domain-containing protein [Candidatus Tectomicrobia bacterium]|nr:DUF4845 domain-containing protein [Candidatus Tectomicrobia bacterium]
MHNLKQQAGLSVLPIFFGLLIGGLVVLLGFKIGPLYLEHYGVASSLKSLEKDAGMRRKSAAELMTILRKRLDINDVKRVSREDITIKKQPRQTTVRVAYEVQVPLAGNVDLLVTFDNTAMLR